MKSNEKNKIDGESSNSAKVPPPQSGGKEANEITKGDNMEEKTGSNKPSVTSQKVSFGGVSPEATGQADKPVVTKETNNTYKGVQPVIQAAVSGTVQKALEMSAFITDDPSTQRQVVLMGLRAQMIDGNQIRPPVCFDLGATGDPATALVIAKGFANTDAAYSDTSAQVLNHLVRTGWTLFVVRDRIALQQVKRFAYKRSLPGISLFPIKEINDDLNYGETFILVMGELSEEFDLYSHTLHCEQANVDAKRLAEAAQNVVMFRKELLALSQKIRPELTINPEDLPSPSVPAMYLYRATLFLAAIAKWLDAHCSQGGFLAAVQQYWAQVVSQASTRVSPKVVDAIVAQYTLAHIAVHVADYNKGWKEESIVETIRKSDTALFGAYTETTYGKFLGKYGLGVIGRHGFPDGNILQYRSYVRFSREDVAKLERMAAELQEGMPTKE